MLFTKNLDEHYINQNYHPSADAYVELLNNPEPDLNYGKLMDGKVCLVTGASYGMGYDMAELYAKHGGRLVITARGREKLEAAAQKIRERVPGAEVIAIPADACSKEDTEKLFSTILEKYGRLDTMLLNAGIGEGYRAETFPDDLLDVVVETNFKGPARYCRAALKIMLPQNYGNIVVVSSVNGVRPLCGTVYSSTKGALNTMVKNIAIRCVGTGVHINALCPGFTVTPASLAQESGDSFHAPAGEDNIGILHSHSVRNVPTVPADQANLALFLGSDMSRAVTGQVIVCDNGQYL